MYAMGLVQRVAVACHAGSVISLRAKEPCLRVLWLVQRRVRHVPRQSSAVNLNNRVANAELSRVRQEVSVSPWHEPLTCIDGVSP